MLVMLVYIKCNIRLLKKNNYCFRKIKNGLYFCKIFSSWSRLLLVWVSNFRSRNCRSRSRSWSQKTYRVSVSVLVLTFAVWSTSPLHIPSITHDTLLGSPWISGPRSYLVWSFKWVLRYSPCETKIQTLVCARFESFGQPCQTWHPRF